MTMPLASTNPTKTAMRRLQKDYEHLQKDPVANVIALPNDQNILEWHFVYDGSKDTDYEGGQYHGMLVFPPDFPFQPPAIGVFTPNGRFLTNYRLCLSISDYHPESWNPGWTVPAIIVGLISFMNDEECAQGVLHGRISPAERRRLAQDSRRFNLTTPAFVRLFPELAAKNKSMLKFSTREMVGGASVTATSRLKKDYHKLLKEPVPYIRAAPRSENILIWQYVIFGAPDTPYHGGVYHGKLVFPADFPFKPPSIYMITPSGRFQTNTRLCLSISDFHPDTWNPAWTVSTIITGLLSFMNDTAPTLGSVVTTDAEKKILARRSKMFNLKDKMFCEIFSDIAEELRAELASQQQGSPEESAVSDDDSARRDSSGGGGGLSSLVSNLIVIAGVVVLALAVRYVIKTAQDAEQRFH